MRNNEKIGTIMRNNEKRYPSMAKNPGIPDKSFLSCPGSKCDLGKHQVSGMVSVPYLKNGFPYF